MACNVPRLMEQASVLRARNDWAAARRLYEAAAAAAPGTGGIHHNIALCLYAQGSSKAAYEHAEIATRRAPQLVPAWVLRAKIERALNEIQCAAASLTTALALQPRDPQALLALADLTLNELGNARHAQDLVAPLVGHPEYDRDAQLATLVAKLYDRDESAEAYTRELMAFATRYLKMPGFRFSAKRIARDRSGEARIRVALLSPLFCVSPVYFFTIGALSLLSEEVDLVFFNRGTRSDWATARFQAIAHEWHDVAHLPAAALANALYAQNLDVLIDLGGWMDAIALRAVSTRPAAAQFKWVGGQSCTTGLDAFDGFVTDEDQTPAASAHLYSEPLLSFDSGYVSYTPPDYLPAPHAPEAGTRLYGVIANPAKLSDGFLRDLALVCAGVLGEGGALWFIDRRYRHPQVRERVSAELARGGTAAGFQSGRIRFIAPESHREYLMHVSRLTQILDTAPYSGGLSTIEALWMDVPCASRPRALFCERHSISHMKFCGLGPRTSAFARAGRWIVSSHSGRPIAHCARASHAAVAENLLRAIRRTQPARALRVARAATAQTARSC